MSLNCGIARFEKVSFDEYKKVRKLGFSTNNLDPTLFVSKSSLLKEYESIQLPKRSTLGSAGYDFKLPFEFIILPHSSLFIYTGIKCSLSNGYVLMLYPRSSLGFKYKLSLDNTVGIIDSDYYNNPDNEGHIIVKMTNHSDNTLPIKSNQSYVQGLIQKYYITNDDYVEIVRNSGIGSTDQ